MTDSDRFMKAITFDNRGMPCVPLMDDGFTSEFADGFRHAIELVETHADIIGPDDVVVDGWKANLMIALQAAIIIVVILAVLHWTGLYGGV